MPSNFLNYPNYPKGLRNNNPGNLRPLPSGQWQGEIKPSDHTGFSRFSDVSWGLRAMITDITGDIVKDGLNTLTKLINQYAPASDNNNTTAYIKAVSDSTGIPPDAIIKPDRNTIEKIIKGKLKVELGQSYAAKITQDDINTAFDRLSPQVKGWIVPAATGAGIAIAIALMAYLYRKELGI